MISNSLINTGVFEQRLKAELNRDLVEAAEPLIKEALVTIEKKIREQLAASLVSIVKQAHSIQYMRDEIHIVVHNKEYM